MISGTAVTAGTLRLTIGAVNPTGTGSASLTITVAAPPAITSATAVTAHLHQGFSYQIAATNQPTSYSATGLRDGLTLDPGTGAISGTPATAGTVHLTISATNADGTGSASLTITISAVPVITSAATATAVLRQPFSYGITAVNQPASYSATGLRDGLTLNTATGVISGTPGTAGTVKLTISAANSAGTGSASLAITVTEGNP